MYDIVDVLLKYMDTRNASILIASDIQFCKSDLTVIVIDILSWLKLEYKRSIWKLEGRRTCLKPMEIKSQYPYSVLLVQLVQKEKIFKDYFVISDKGLEFNETVTSFDRDMMRQKAYKEYNPPTFR